MSCIKIYIATINNGGFPVSLSSILECAWSGNNILFFFILRLFLTVMEIVFIC